MNIQQYVNNINERYQRGNATEHTFRGDLQQLLEYLIPDVGVTNEPKRQSCGAPDYILTKKDIPVGFIEAKNIGDNDLDGIKKTGNKEQFDRYKASLNNLIFTDYLSFHLYREGVFITNISIAEITEKGIKPLTDNFARFIDLIKDFANYFGQTINSSKKLAEMMAGKARLLSDVIEKALTSDERNNENSTLKDQMNAFKQVLIHDITAKGFADVYAQTIAYGMFAARLHDTHLETFSRQEAAELIPKSNPFLRKLFGYIAGPDIDDRIKWIVDGLVDIFLACNVADILKSYGKNTKMEDPIIHFYENFLSEYDPILRKARGVWYTPQPIVNFIVRAVDDVLKTEFGLSQGLADTSKIKINLDVQGKKVEQVVHTVQILDPATGTGTFLAETIKHIHQKFKGQQGIWSNYVETHLLPRLNGFELLMASYAMAHLQLELLLTETGYKPSAKHLNQRLKVYLTNSLEEYHPDTGTLFTSWLSAEANEANHIKRDTPVMCIMGNPPYSGVSSNNGEWISKLIEDYKYIDGIHFNERKHWLNDDYVKFLRFGQHFVEKNGSGILAFINPHGFLDNPTFRGLRWNLLKTYDKIYTIDLHGNAKKKETCSDGSADQNVFDIMQGVSINIFIKSPKKTAFSEKFPSSGGVPAGRGGLAQVYHYDLYGKRDFKYDFLSDNSLNSIDFKQLKPNEPNYFFVPKNDEGRSDYEKGFGINELFTKNVTGIVTMGDEFAFAENKNDLIKRLEDFKNKDISEQELKAKYNLGKNYAEFILKNKNQLKIDETKIIQCSYRPFDNKWTYFDNKILWRWRVDVMQHFLKGENVGLALCKQFKTGDNYLHSFITDKIIESSFVSNRTSEITSIFPLYFYSDTDGQQSITTPPCGHPSKGGEFNGSQNGGEFNGSQNGGEFKSSVRTPNLNAEIVKKIAEQLGLTFVNEKQSNSPPLEGCPQGGVVKNNEQAANLSTVLQGGVVKNNEQSANLSTVSQGGVVKVPLTTINNTIIYKQFIEKLPHNSKLNQLAKDKRKEGILSEVLFWQQVHKNKFHQLDFDRQTIIGNYIVDFYVKSLGLVIEIDGSSHDNKKEYDQERQSFLEAIGLKVFRCSDIDVKSNISGVLITLEQFIIKEYGQEYTAIAFECSSKGGDFAPIDLLDYIYAVLHSPAYREKYKEFLKIDFPKIPYPKNTDVFWQLVKLGGQIRQIHLLESPLVEDYITQYPINGENRVSNLRFENNHPAINGTPPKEGNLGKVYINETQYFDNVPLIAWEFYIGGYQPAQKWLKDRKGRVLEFDDILHYQKIIVALTKTDELMKQINAIDIE